MLGPQPLLQREPQPEQQEDGDHGGVEQRLEGPGLHQPEEMDRSRRGGDIDEPVQPLPGAPPSRRIMALLEVMASGTRVVIASMPTVM